MTNPTGLDEVHKKLDAIARLQDRHGKRLDDMVGSSARLYSRVRDVAETVDRLNSRMDLMGATQCANCTSLDMLQDF